MPDEQFEMVNLVRWKSDQASYQALLKQQETLHNRFRDLGKQLGVVSAQMQAASAAYKSGGMTVEGHGKLIADLEAQYKALDTEQGETLSSYSALESAIIQAQKSFGTATTAAAEYAGTLDRVQQEQQDVAVAATEAGRAQEQSARDAERAARRQQESLSRAGRGVSGIGQGLSILDPSLMGITGPTSGVFQAIRGFEVLQQELPALKEQLLGTAGGAAKLALAGAALAVEFEVIKGLFDGLSDASDNVKALVGGQIDAYGKFHDFMIDATSEELHGEIEATQKKDLANRAYYADLIELRGRVEGALDQGRGINLAGLSEGALQLYDLFGGDAVGLEKIDEALKQNISRGEQYRIYLGLLTQAVIEGATAANDTAQREEEATKRRVEAVERGIQTEIERADFIETASSEQVKQRLAAIEVERTAKEKAIAALEPLAAISDEASANLDALRDDLFLLGEEETFLRSTAQPLIELRERETAAAKAFMEAVGPSGVFGQLLTMLQNDLAGVLAEPRDATTDAIKDYREKSAEIEAERELDILQDKAKAARKQALDRVHHYQDLAEIDDKYYDDVAKQLEKMADGVADVDKDKLDEIADYNKQARRMAQDHRREMLQIERDLNQGIESAIEDRNISGAIEAARNAENQARDSQEQYELEADRRAEDQADRLKELDEQRAEKLKAGREALDDLRRQHDKERADRITAFNQKQREEQAEAQFRQYQQQQQWALDDQQRQARFTAQYGAEATHWATMTGITTRGMQSVQSAMVSGFNSTVAALITQTQLQQAMAVFAQPRPYAAGGMVTAGEIISVGERGAELAQFQRDGAWRIFNNAERRQVFKTMDRQIAVSMPVTIENAGGDVNAIVGVFEQRILPRLTQSVQRAMTG